MQNIKVKKGNKETRFISNQVTAIDVPINLVCKYHLPGWLKNIENGPLTSLNL
jgi:hypothetical protein